jgi:hypothetical protein
MNGEMGVEQDHDLCKPSQILGPEFELHSGYRKIPLIPRQNNKEKSNAQDLTLGRLIAALWPTNRPMGWISKLLLIFQNVFLSHFEESK